MFWKKAAIQVFFSLGAAQGGLVTMASYNVFHNNVERDGIIVCAIDSFSSLLAGCTIFATIGHLAHSLDLHVTGVVKEGLSLAFVAYPETISRLWAAPAWSVLFFLMMISLGMGTQFVLFEAPATCIVDMFPKLRVPEYRVTFVGCLCVANFLIGLNFCTQSGIYIFTLFDDYSVGYCSILIVLCESVLIAYVYGIDRFIDDIALMLGKKLNWYWRITWLINAPVYFLILFGFLVHYHVPSNYGKNPVIYFLLWMECMGLLISPTSIVSIVGFAVYHIVQNRRSGKNWIALVLPSPDFNPKRRHEESLAAAAKKDKEEEG